LSNFLKLHPKLRAFDSFEENEFFTDKNYFKGIDWYFSKILYKKMILLIYTIRYIDQLNFHTNESFITYEISENYFYDPKVPQRIVKFVDNLKPILVLFDPIDLAYSCYEVRIKKKYIILNIINFSKTFLKE
jgi:hypothetical protein